MPSQPAKASKKDFEFKLILDSRYIDEIKLRCNLNETFGKDNFIACVGFWWASRRFLVLMPWQIKNHRWIIETPQKLDEVSRPRSR